MLPVIIGHTPAGASTKTLLHFAQGVNSKKFRFYDYGEVENLQRYGQKDAPDYNLSQVTAPVYLLWGENDWLAPKEVSSENLL